MIPLYGLVSLILALFLIPYTERVLLSRFHIVLDAKSKVVIAILLFFLMIALYRPPENMSQSEEDGEVQGASEETADIHVEDDIDDVNEEAEGEPTQKPEPTDMPQPTAVPEPTSTRVPQPTATQIPPTQAPQQVQPSSTAMPPPTSAPVQQEVAAPQPAYGCDCSKTCTQMGCEEAYFQLNQCGCSRRDGDSDGIPCENVCL